MATTYLDESATARKSLAHIHIPFDREPVSLDDWKRSFRNHIEEARRAVMLDRDREALIDYVKEEAELIFYSPYLGLLDEGEGR